MKQIWLLISLLVLFISQQSHAALLVEPYAGLHVNSRYGYGDISKDGSITGSAYGARVGTQHFGLMFGLSGKKASFTLQDIDLGTLETSTLGVFVGYDMPLLFRFWFEYMFSGTGTWSDDDDNAKLNISQGSTFGIGYKTLPFVSFNLEVSLLKFNESIGDTVTNKIDAHATLFMLSISVPLTF
jgi:hypothetical protein